MALSDPMTRQTMNLVDGWVWPDSLDGLVAAPDSHRVLLEVRSAEAVFARAVAVGATIRQPLADMFWGTGHRWNIRQQPRDVPDAEVVAGAAAAFSSQTVAAMNRHRHREAGWA